MASKDDVAQLDSGDAELNGANENGKGTLIQHVENAFRIQLQKMWKMKTVTKTTFQRKWKTS